MSLAANRAGKCLSDHHDGGDGRGEGGIHDNPGKPHHKVNGNANEIQYEVYIFATASLAIKNAK